MYTNRKERSHFQLSCGVCVCVFCLFVPRLGIILFATLHSITLPRNLSNIAGAVAKYLRHPYGKTLNIKKIIL